MNMLDVVPMKGCRVKYRVDYMHTYLGGKNARN